jgi:histidyl-tRNA synthetase
VSCKNILVPLGKDSKDLKALYHAMSLAERVQSRVLVLSLEESTKKQEKKSQFIEACLDVIRSACEQGLHISFHIASNSSKTEFLELLKREHIDLIILSDTEILIKKMIKKSMTMISCQVVQVREKNDINLIQ